MTLELKDIIQQLIIKVALQRALTTLFAALPFLAWPIINPIFMYVLNAVIAPFTNELAVYGVFAYYSFRTDAEEASYIAESQKILDAQGGKLNDATQASYDSALANLIHLHP